MKIIFVFILILFIDSVNRVYRVQVELQAAHDSAKNGYASPAPPSLALSALHATTQHVQASLT